MDQPFGWDFFDPPIPRPDQKKDPLWISFLSSIALELPPPGRKEALRSFRSCSIRHPILVSTRARYSARYMPIAAQSQPISNPLHGQKTGHIWHGLAPISGQRLAHFLSHFCPGLIMGWKQTRIVPSIRPVPSWSGRGSFLAPYCADISPDLAQSIPGTDQDRIRYQTDPIPFPTHSWADSGLFLAQDRARS